MRFIDRDEIARRLTCELCIPIVREAMIAFSKGETRQLLRSILPLADGRLFGVMPGAMGERAVFGAKLISVFPENFAKEVQSHQGVVVLFDADTGAPICVLHAGEITAIRTAAASAVATDALARKDASRLALLGYGEQARTHAPSPRCASFPPSRCGAALQSARRRSRLGCRPNSAYRSFQRRACACAWSTPTSSAR